MKKLNYWQVHKNKKPKKNRYLQIIRIEKHLDLLAKQIVKTTDSLISFQYALSNIGCTAGKILCYMDSPGGNV